MSSLSSELQQVFKEHADKARPVRKAAVLGAGIMGGGITITSAAHGVPVLMKDIAEAQLELGMNEARRQVGRLVQKEKITPEQAEEVMASIDPTLEYLGFDQVDAVIEAVVENLDLKHRVLDELENVVRDEAIIATNTSSLRIDDIGQHMKHPERFVGMHFFNPVPVMPLVEIIQGTKTRDEAVSTAVTWALKMGKTPIVVQDCPGFLVNRILTAYTRAFLELVAEGVDFEHIDKSMEAFGWPMGPAYLEDVIGIDTGSHVSDVISAGYPDRMPHIENDAFRLMKSRDRLGQKNGKGFYDYTPDDSGRPQKHSSPEAHELIRTIQPNGRKELSVEEIQQRMMLAMITESVHCLEDRVVGSAEELDTALLMGVGFPRDKGGAIRYADSLGAKAVLAQCELYRHLGAQYEPTATIRKLAETDGSFYDEFPAGN
ncbi:3-hydroxyacyl-CoA dehydrogenase / enoyl-CoA hydratase / 3-hydroxybutyryl-CoA epimerase / enoyl-CoA isomerase [Marinobacter daqiaonensis]|uniref:3-hydroxyacyl-CoA dehydrogenase / enoyl-CoA hydratase / 3-hydroxybutyryl-CoA epimerase / enoyl-CoA isomerase n=1 Tax=Marinobacter daqiaonensis TaxID=650891 RepID=A0A1I6INI0_9GAMM|nr:3-hydroxyacyl-CoA dehydrogenase NAD-binding domain-containing protein [Marinobacter daqiaonensis]SFR68327.1 3-hydroxyacyl-CoA dehydrogenase / enoyl-CoA hydratase / 3-hydroxybutyryl-CoA epimerase / enoyl-CoA isomerase [Marinobacter daqiaonensis]